MMHQLSQRSKFSVYGLIVLWIIIGIAYYRNVNLTVILPLFLATLFHRISRQGRQLVIKKTQVFLFLFVLYYLFISLLFFKGLPGFTNLIIRYVMLPSIAFYWSNRAMQNTSVKAFFISCMKWLIFFFAWFGIYEWFSRYNPIAEFIVTGAGDWIRRMNQFAQVVYYPSSLFTHYTYFAYVLLVGWLLSHIFPFKNRLLDFCYKLSILFALLVSQSRMSWIAFLIVMLIYVVTFVRKVRLTAILGLPVMLVGLILSGALEKVAGLISERFSRLFALGFSDGSLGQRFGTLQNVAPYMSEHPIKAMTGGGYGSAMLDFLPKYSYFAGFQTTDSMVTTYLIEAGIFGVILLLIGIVTYMLSLDKKNIFDRFLILFLVMSMIEMFFFDFFANNITLFLFFLVWGVMASQKNDTDLEAL